jgi:hypothetical protein
MFSINFFFTDSIGSLADWFMVVISILTTIFLILNFKSQLIIQRAQLRVTEIENERYRIDFLPLIELSHNGIESDFTNPNLILCPNFVFLMAENACKCFKMKVVKQTNCTFKWPDGYIFTFPTLLQNDTVIFTPTITFSKETYHDSKASVHFEVFFVDFVGNQYKQDFIFNYSKAGHTIDKFAPEVLSDKHLHRC